MPLHFNREEFSKRLDRLKELMSAEKLDGILLFRQESMFYLTGLAVWFNNFSVK